MISDADPRIPPAGIRYRADIDGLRAIAVIGVILFHFQLGRATGGFVGVDVFFVISGYLITGIIEREIAEGRFSFASFYERRVRRLFPALFVVLLTTLLLGVAFLLPSDLHRTGVFAASTLFFVSNFTFLGESGYFNTAAEFNPLLHTWSLAVEEQFYIFLPPLLLLAARLRPAWRKGWLIALMGTSLIACISLQARMPHAVFFLAPFRAWEFLLGSLLVLRAFPGLATRFQREIAGIAGFALLGVAFFKLQGGSSYPGWHAIAPVLGAALIIESGRDGTSFARRLLEWRPIVWIGLASYSLYLWHWPILFFARYMNGMQPLDGRLTGLLVATFLVSFASYRWVERPFRVRHSRDSEMKPMLLRVATATALLALAAIAVLLDGGLRFRSPSQVLALDALRDPPIPFLACEQHVPDLGGCRIGDPSAVPDILVWGDSTALAWAPAFDKVLRSKGLSGYLAWSSACPPLADVGNPAFPQCAGFNADVIESLRRHPVRSIVLVAIWPSYSRPDAPYSLVDGVGRSGNVSVFPSALHRTADLLSRMATHVVVVAPTPGAPHDIVFRAAIAKQRGQAEIPPVGRGQYLGESAAFWHAARQLDQSVGATILDPAPWFCGETVCAYQGVDKQFLYRDEGHLSSRGAEYMAARLLDSRKQLPWLTPAMDN